MKVFIYSRETIGKLLESDFPENAAVISFYDPPGSLSDHADAPWCVLYCPAAEIITTPTLGREDAEKVFGENEGNL